MLKIVETFQKDLDAESTSKFGFLLIQLLKQVCVIFPQEKDVQKTKDTIELIFSNPIFATNFVSRWFDGMAMDVPESVSYGPAFKRLTGRNIDYFAVAKYRDHRVLFENPILKENIDCALTQKFEDPVFADYRKAFFKGMDELNRLSVFVRRVSVGDIPSRESISANIMQQKQKKDKKKQTGDRDMSLALLADAISACAEDQDEVEAEKLQQLISSLRSGSTAIDPQEFHDSLQHNHVFESETPAETLAGIDTVFVNIECISKILATDTPARKKLMEGLQRFVTFNAVASNISTNLLNTVQDEINGVEGLVGDDGQVDMSKVDMATMLPNLMAKIDPEEVKEMAGNLGDMVPQMQKLASELGAANGMDTAGMMQKVMAMGAGGMPNV